MLGRSSKVEWVEEVDNSQFLKGPHTEDPDEPTPKKGVNASHLDQSHVIQGRRCRSAVTYNETKLGRRSLNLSEDIAKRTSTKRQHTTNEDCPVHQKKLRTLHSDIIAQDNCSLEDGIFCAEYKLDGSHCGLAQPTIMLIKEIQNEQQSTKEEIAELRQKIETLVDSINERTDDKEWKTSRKPLSPDSDHAENATEDEQTSVPYDMGAIKYDVKQTDEEELASMQAQLQTATKSIRTSHDHTEQWSAMLMDQKKEIQLLTEKNGTLTEELALLKTRGVEVTALNEELASMQTQLQAATEYIKTSHDRIEQWRAMLMGQQQEIGQLKEKNGKLEEELALSKTRGVELTALNEGQAATIRLNEQSIAQLECDLSNSRKTVYDTSSKLLNEQKGRQQERRRISELSSEYQRLEGAVGSLRAEAKRASHIMEVQRSATFRLASELRQRERQQAHAKVYSQDIFEFIASTECETFSI